MFSHILELPFIKYFFFFSVAIYIFTYVWSSCSFNRVLGPILNMPVSESKRQRVLVASSILYSEVSLFIIVVE